MKKKLLSIVLCIAMLFTFSASGALAEEIETENQTNTEQNIEVNVDDSNQDITEENPVDDEIGDVNTDENQSSEEGTDISDENTDSNTDTDTEDEISDTPQNPQEGSDVVPEDSDSTTESQDYSTMSTEELYAYIMQLGTDEEIEAVLAELPQETIDALVAYAQEQAMRDYVPPETVVFTEAGPFLPPVSVTIEQQVRNAMRRMVIRANNYALNALDAAIDAYADEGNGLELSKEVVSANKDGSYRIRMEAYTTGTVTTSTKTVPVDIVLVLDQSGSMAFDFNGNSTNTNADRRQYAMKQAVNNFISAVADKYTKDADHRMAIVTFGSNASTLQGWTSVDEAGKTTLQGTISGLPDTPSGATNVAAGMSRAESLMGSVYNYSGSNTQRQKVVIVFTDGVPTTGSDFDTDVATSAILSAKNLKDSGATVYTIGIFRGANIEQLHDSSVAGNVNDIWDGARIFGWGDVSQLSIPAANRFLNYLSSNFVDTTEIGLDHVLYNIYVAAYERFTITRNFTRTDDCYYLTADNSTSLNEIFQTISDNIQTANIDLGSDTVIKDTVSPYFDLPASAGDIKLYTAAAKADGSFEDAVSASGVTATIENNAVTVKGFNFNDNFVSENAKSDGTYGKKLIIEFNVTPKDEFIGGNDVPTNDWENTAVYDKNGLEVKKFANASTTPTVNVPIKSPVFYANDKTIYEGNSTAVSGLYTLPATTGWQFDYVDVTVSGVNSETVSPTDCKDYTINVNYAPKTDGSGLMKGTPNAMAGVSAGQTATVHVLKHDVTATVNDVQKYYGELYTLGDEVTPDITVDWKDKNSHTGIPAAVEKPPYMENDLSLSYAASGYNGTVPKDDFDVTVTVKKDETEISDAKIITNCTFGCTNNREDGKYKVHVETCQLTVAKTGGASDEPYVFTVKKDNQPYSEITIVGNSSKTVYELPVGNYSIEEDTGWGWRYTPVYSSSVTLGSDNPSDTINCTNTSEISKWLNGFSSVVKNIYGSANQ